MLKTYDKESDIPEGLRSEYKQSGTKWVPDLSDDHPVLVLSKTLKQEKEVVEARAKKLSSDLDDALEAAKTSGVPRGQALVSKADAEAVAAYKALGTVDEVKAKLDEHGTLKTDAANRKREDSLVLAAGELGFDPELFKRLSNLPDLEVRSGSDGKKQVIALVKDGDKIVERPAMEFLESSPDHKPFLPKLKVQSGVTVHGTGSTQQQTTNPDPFAWARDFAKNYSEAAAPTTDLAKSFAERSA
jgi:hypothetical protein